MFKEKLCQNFKRFKVNYGFQSLINEKRYIFILIVVIIFSFTLYMISLSFFPISYGPDGPFYDIQVRYIMRTGFPESNDGPLVYYYLLPFVLLTGNSFLGIKIGMALISSLMAIPAFLLTETFTKKIGVESRIPALLSAFLMTINVYCFRMIEDFMQNLAGVFFLLFFIYYYIRWLEDIKKWKKNGLLTSFFLVCSVLTHIYTAGLAIVLFPSLYIFNFCFKWVKDRKLPQLEFFLLIVGGFLLLLGLIIILIFFPDVQLDRIITFAQSLMTISYTGFNKFSMDINIFMTIPFIIGFIAAIFYFIYTLKNTNDKDLEQRNKKIALLSFQYLFLFILLLFLILIRTSWQDRFLLLSFMPLGLIIPLGLKGLDYLILKRYKTVSRQSRQSLIGILAIIYIVSSLGTTIVFIPRMGPFISMREYEGLDYIRVNLIPSGIVNNSGIISVDEYHLGYWVEYMLDMQYYTGNITENHGDYLGKPIYAIYFKDPFSPFNPNYQYPWFPLFPYGLPILKPAGAPPPIIGTIIFNTPALTMTLLYYWNGTRTY